VRLAVLIALGGCGFTPGAISTTSDAADGSGSGSGSGATCNDGLQNGDETGIDCGGSCSACAGNCTNHVVPPSLTVDVAQASSKFLAAPTWTCNAAGTTTIDSATGSVSSTSCALGAISSDNDVPQLGAGGAPVFVLRLRGLALTNGHVLRLIGDKPHVILVAGDVSVDSGAMIDASAAASEPGPGGKITGLCADRINGAGVQATTPGWGGGGGGYGTAGGQGCYNVINGGAAHGDDLLVPLRGGCSGGTGNGAAAQGQQVGAGGGAFELAASGTITIGATGAANLVASGGGAPMFSGGGNGGGSGGAIVVIAPALATFGTAGAIRAHGGAGSEGSGNPSDINNPGTDGHKTDNTPATDTSGIAGGGNGNDRGRAGGLAHKVGAGAITSTAGSMTTAQTGGRGGGGGGGGRMRIATGAATPACD
jgi:hypothetical protein